MIFFFVNFDFSESSMQTHNFVWKGLNKLKYEKVINQIKIVLDKTICLKDL